MKKVAMRMTLKDNVTTVSKTFDKIDDSKADATIVEMVKALCVAYQAPSATYTIYNYTKGAVEGE